MKDSEFIELLNLYLDHEISAADAARLEAEVQTNPARRKVYQQYCRMQKACKVLAADFATEPTIATSSDKKVVAFDRAVAEAATQRRKRAGNFYTIGTIAAAAACVAIVFVGRNRQSEAEQAAVMAQQQGKVVNEVAVSATATSPARTIEVKPIMIASAPAEAGPRALGSTINSASAMLVGNPLLLSGNAQADALMAAATQQANAQFAWMQDVKLAPIPQPAPLNELRFDTAPATLRSESRALGNRAPANANVEWAAFQFVK